MNAIVLFDTLFGNTEKIALSIARGLQDAGVEARAVNIKDANMDGLAGYDLLALGAPTQYFTASKPLKVFLERLEGSSGHRIAQALIIQRDKAMDLDIH